MLQAGISRNVDPGTNTRAQSHALVTYDTDSADPGSTTTPPPTAIDNECRKIEGYLKHVLRIQRVRESTTGQQDEWTRQDQEDYDRLFVRDPPQWTTWPTARQFREFYEEQNHNYSHTREFARMADAFNAFEAKKPATR
eukprot:g31181.t1